MGNLVSVYSEYKGPEFGGMFLGLWDGPTITRRAGLAGLFITYPEIFANSVSSLNYIAGTDQKAINLLELPVSFKSELRF